MRNATTHVAIVDDENSVRRALIRVLRLEEFNVRDFGSAEELLASLQDYRPDCIILDLHMPGMTGLECLAHFSDLDYRLPVIVLTAHDDAETRRRCRSLGVACLLGKPIDRDDLLNAVRELTRT